VPDERVDRLAEVYQPKKKTYAEISFVDVAGPEGASETGLDKALVGEMRPVDALVHVVRAFDNPALTRNADPLRDLIDFDTEAVLTDQIQIETKLEKLRKEGQKTRERDFLEALHAHLDAGQPLRIKAMSEQELASISGFAFLSLKPCIAVLSQPDEHAATPPDDSLVEAARERGVEVLSMAGRAEAEIAELDSAEQVEFLRDLGLEGSSRERFIAAVYGHLDLISFLTRNAEDCHAWPIRRGTTAHRAAGRVHTDIERGFIRAEVIAFSDFERLGSDAACRDAGVMRVEGKDYVVVDGDLIHFRFNV
jgi:GTP-binding protein YchF